MASDQAQLVRRLRKQGFHVQQGGKHYKVRRDGDSQFVTMPVTPSDYRSIQNTIASLKSIGYDPETDTKAMTRRERALAEARRHNEKIDAQTVDYSDYKPSKPEPEPESVSYDGPAIGAQYRDLTARAMGKVVMTDRTQRQIGLQVLSGRACEECKKPFDQCLKTLNGRSRACCGPCSSYDTHDLQTVRELHRWEPYEGEGPCEDSRRNARAFIRQGYSICSVMQRTGVGSRWLEDLVGEDGYLRRSLA